MWPYGLNPLMVSHTPVKFDDRHCGSEDMMILVCHVILSDHVTKGFSNVMSGSPSRLVTILSSLVARGTVVVEI